MSELIKYEAKEQVISSREKRDRSSKYKQNILKPGAHKIQQSQLEKPDLENKGNILELGAYKASQLTDETAGF